MYIGFFMVFCLKETVMIGYCSVSLPKKGLKRLRIVKLFLTIGRIILLEKFFGGNVNLGDSLKGWQPEHKPITHASNQTARSESWQPRVGLVLLEGPYPL